MANEIFKKSSENCSWNNNDEVKCYKRCGAFHKKSFYNKIENNLTLSRNAIVKKSSGTLIHSRLAIQWTWMSK